METQFEELARRGFRFEINCSPLIVRDLSRTREELLPYSSRNILAIAQEAFRRRHGMTSLNTTFSIPRASIRATSL